MLFDFTIQGIFRIVTLQAAVAERVVLCFNTKEDGTDGGAYWVLAEKSPATGRWRDFPDMDALPRIHPKDREKIVSDETISKMDAELILFLCQCQREEGE